MSKALPPGSSRHERRFALLADAICDQYITPEAGHPKDLPAGWRVDPPEPIRPSPLDRALRVDAACGRFEAAWRAGDAPRIEAFLGPEADPDRPAFLRELLAIELELRRDSGEVPSEAEYRDRLPGDVEVVAEVFRGLSEGSTVSRAEPSPRRSPVEGVEAGRPLRFGPYELLEEVARGGMGVVYRARQVELKRIVAVKMILAGRFASGVETRRFRAEAEAAANLNHPGIVPIHEVGEHDGISFFSMKFIEGGNLSKHAGAFLGDPEASARLIATIAGAIQHAHDRGIIHRDLKPSNILLDDGRPLVADFGLAKRLGDDPGLTHTGAPVGTPAYMAPEQAAGRATSASADIYSLGAILYRLLAGRPPFQAPTVAETLDRIAEADPPSPRALRPELPRDLARVCMKCLEKSPEARYPSAVALADDLGRFLRGEPVLIGRMGRLDRFRRWIRRGPELAFRLLALSSITALTQVNYQITPDPDLLIHTEITVVELAWLASSITFHRLSKADARRDQVRTAWIAADIVLLTASLRILDAATSSLTVGYPLLIVTSGLWSRARFVWLTTGFAMVGFSVLAFDTWCRAHRAAGNHHPNILLATMAVSGAVVAHQLKRSWATVASDKPAPTP